MNLFSKILITAMLLSFVFSNAQISKAEIVATGLTCSMCSNAINKQLKSMPEVLSVDSDINTSTFTIVLKKDNKLNPKIFKDKVEKAGFFIGSILVTMDGDMLKNSDFVVVGDKKSDNQNVQVQILDKGYVTEKAFKNFSKKYKDIASFSVKNENDFHVKIIK